MCEAVWNKAEEQMLLLSVESVCPYTPTLPACVQDPAEAALTYVPACSLLQFSLRRPRRGPRGRRTIAVPQQALPLPCWLPVPWDGAAR